MCKAFSFLLKKRNCEAGEKAYLVKCLSNKNEDLSSEPQHPRKNPGVMLCAGNYSAGVRGQLGPWSSLARWPSLFVAHKTQWETLSQKFMWRVIEETGQDRPQATVGGGGGHINTSASQWSFFLHPLSALCTQGPLVTWLEHRQSCLPEGLSCSASGREEPKVL